ncbi:hypothetical protein NP493_243g02044 [Ridgeia piscesae]|uniref:Uncharacterized protein n=1 Tax=Ridgeia piscesae TaxID=27915 RepID=A0AAD9NZ80_RIDPI|nr:hypothetical protein NP493_243g02044 [Ridgeia piscesae]
MLVIIKKENNKDLKNYRPKCLLSSICQKSKTKATICVNNTLVENVESYIYRKQRYSTRDKNKKDREIQRRVSAGWTAFAKYLDIFKGNIGTCLKRQVYNSCIVPIRRGTMGTLESRKEQAGSRTNKDGEEV